MSSARTELQKDASRTNGSLSTGPVTDEGKIRSSQNATKHGIFSKKVIVEGESQEEFDSLTESIDARWSPATEEEQETVRELILLRWRIRRASTVESNLLSAATTEGDPGTTAKEMFKIMDNVSKYQARLRRLESSGEQRLREIQEARIKKEKEREEQETKHERAVAEYRQYARRVLLHRCILKDPMEKMQTVEQVLGVEEVPTDRDVLEALLAQIVAKYNQECYERAASKNGAAA